MRCLIGGEEFHHADEIITPHFEDEELGYLDEYRSSLKDLFSPLDQSPEFEGEVSEADAELLELCVQYSENEPDLGVLELLELDKKSNAFEIKRLCTMGVLEPASEVPADASELSTRYVNTWRAKKIAGEMRWLRRSRFVAREFASEDVNRQGLFAPATSSLVTRVIPSVWANYRSKGWFLGCLDIKDAYLTVHQQSFCVVTLEENGERKHFVLRRCLPGQRDGAALWYQDFHDFLVSRVSADASVVCPTLFRSVDEAGELRMVAMVHVDDMNFAVSPQFKDEFLGTLRSVYDVSCDILEESGEFWFLKRRHHLLADGSLAMSPNQMHFAKLFELMELYPGVHRPKRTPCHPSIQEVDHSPPLEHHLATLYRTCVGVLLYLASDLFSCQFAIKCLAQGMSKPTEILFRCLKHLVQYIMGITGYHLVHLEPRADDVRGLLGYRYEGRSHVLEIFCDSDWAGSKSTRRSTSSAVFAYQGNVIHTSCRGQKVVSLSSAESEYNSMASAACDGVFLREIFRFINGADPHVALYTDSSAAKGIALRSGSGRVRHIGCKLLWLRQQIKDGLMVISSVPTLCNVADLSTKPLGKDRIAFLLHHLRIVDEHDRWELVGTSEVLQQAEKEEAKRTIKQLRVRLIQETGSVSNTSAAAKIPLPQVRLDRRGHHGSVFADRALAAAGRHARAPAAPPCYMYHMCYMALTRQPAELYTTHIASQHVPNAPASSEDFMNNVGELIYESAAHVVLVCEEFRHTGPGAQGRPPGLPVQRLRLGGVAPHGPSSADGRVRHARHASTRRRGKHVGLLPQDCREAAPPSSSVHKLGKGKLHDLVKLMTCCRAQRGTMRSMTRSKYDGRVLVKQYEEMTLAEFQSHIIKLNTIYQGDKLLNSGKRPPKTEEDTHLQSRGLMQLRKQLQDNQVQVESLLVSCDRQLRMTDQCKRWMSHEREQRDQTPRPKCGTLSAGQGGSSTE